MKNYQPTVTLVSKGQLIGEVTRAIKKGAYVIKVEQTSDRKRLLVTVWK